LVSDIEAGDSYIFKRRSEREILEIEKELIEERKKVVLK
jgi:hypothetical protein